VGSRKEFENRFSLPEHLIALRAGENKDSMQSQEDREVKTRADQVWHLLGLAWKGRRRELGGDRIKAMDLRATCGFFLIIEMLGNNKERENRIAAKSKQGKGKNIFTRV